MGGPLPRQPEERMKLSVQAQKETPYTLRFPGKQIPTEEEGNDDGVLCRRLAGKISSTYAEVSFSRQTSGLCKINPTNIFSIHVSAGDEDEECIYQVLVDKQGNKVETVKPVSCPVTQPVHSTRTIVENIQIALKAKDSTSAWYFSACATTI